jgi:hypothetical protein
MSSSRRSDVGHARLHFKRSLKKIKFNNGAFLTLENLAACA